MGLFSPVSETARGLRTYMSGVSWLFSHPLQLLLVFIPVVLAVLLFAFGVSSFFDYEDTIMGWILFDKPEAWWGVALYYVSKVFVYLGALLLGIVICFLFASVASSPIYEFVSLAVEKDVTGKPSPELSLLGSLKLMGEELKKALFIVSVSLVLLVIPGLNVLSVFVTAFLVGWDFYDYPLARRGWTFRDRFAFVRQDIFSIIGLGLWMMIPFVQLIMMPLAVAGGTMLSVTALKNKNRL